MSTSLPASWSAAWGADRPLAAELAVESASMLVTFDRLQTPEMLQEGAHRRTASTSNP